MPIRTIWRRAKLSWKIFSSFVLSLSAVLTVLIIAALLIFEFLRTTVNIEPIAVPKSLSETGYTPEVAAKRLRDAVFQAVTDAQSFVHGPEIDLRGERPDIVVPSIGISIDAIAASLLSYLSIG